MTSEQLLSHVEPPMCCLGQLMLKASVRRLLSKPRVVIEYEKQNSSAPEVKEMGRDLCPA
jgi:hypothetical protein